MILLEVSGIQDATISPSGERLLDLKILLNPELIVKICERKCKTGVEVHVNFDCCNCPSDIFTLPTVYYTEQTLAQIYATASIPLSSVLLKQFEKLNGDMVVENCIIPTNKIMYISDKNLIGSYVNGAGSQSYSCEDGVYVQMCGHDVYFDSNCIVEDVYSSLIPAGGSPTSAAGVCNDTETYTVPTGQTESARQVTIAHTDCLLFVFKNGQALSEGVGYSITTGGLITWLEDGVATDIDEGCIIDIRSVCSC